MNWAPRFWSKVDKNRPIVRADLGPCWTWTAGRFENGYGLFRLNRATQPKGAHRVAWMLEHGDPGEASVLHRCDNRVCIRIAHLFLGTQADNMADMHAKGRGALGKKNGAHTKPESRRRGEDNGSSKLTASDVREIRSLLASGNTKTEIARRFGVGRTCITWIANGKHWRGVK